VNRLVLVRHGDAAAGWGDDLDPGLSELGHAQARHVAESLKPLGPLPVVTSPLRRCRETAGPIAEQWNVQPAVEPDVGEIKAPDHDLATRGPWLASVIGNEWPEMPRDQQAWRDAVLACLLALTEDCVVVTHFIAINVAIGSATVDDRVVCRRVGNCSTTMLESDGHSLMLVAAPAEAEKTEML
jgi:broad specificity phosphatase PhoE